VPDAAIERGRPVEPGRAPSLGPRAATPRGAAWAPAATPLASTVPSPPVHDRERRLTIGRIDVEIHNEAPPAPAATPAPPAKASASGAPLSSRFLLKP
jgi:hypothetical protein